MRGVSTTLRSPPTDKRRVPGLQSTAQLSMYRDASKYRVGIKESGLRVVLFIP